MRTANPALNDKILLSQRSRAATGSQVMTINGMVAKTFVLLALLLFSATLVWRKGLVLLDGQATPQMMEIAFQEMGPWMYGGLFAGLIAGFVTVFKANWAPVTAPIYALFEGLFIGGISIIAEAYFSGIVLQAIGLTFGVLVCLLVAYRTGIIQVTDKFRAGVIAATGGVVLVYMATMLLGFFGVGIPYIHSAGPIGIGFSAIVVVIAALNLVLDFDLIESASNQGMPKYMEWYGGFALMVTLIWLYLEILRLLMKLNSRR